MVGLRRRIFGFSAVLLILSACQPTLRGSPGDAASAAHDFVQMVAQQDAEGAWVALSVPTRDAIYDGDEQKFESDVQAADWSTVEWQIAGDPLPRDVVWQVDVSISNVSSTVPGFLVTREIADLWQVASDGGVATDRGIILYLQEDDSGNWAVAGVGLGSRD